MFSHLGAVLLASGALVLLSTVHSISTAPARPQAAIVLVPASGTAQASNTHALPGAAVTAIAIAY
jgi:hypothetical protein